MFKKRPFSTTIMSILVISMLLSLNIPVFATDSSSSTQLQSDRLAGQNRYETSAEITKSGWTTSDYAIIASGENFPDALCGAPLAKKYNAPILLTAKGSLDEQTKNQFTRLQVKNVFIIGGTGVISSDVEQDIKNMGIQVSRIAGNDRYDTSFKVAQTLGQFTQAVIATGENFPDALSIAPIAAMKGIPILLTPKDNLPKGLKEYLNNNVQSTFVVGGIGVVSDNVLSQLPSPKRLSGTSRYETNTGIINEFSNDLDFGNCYLATGENFPDALAGSALASLIKSPVILVSNPVDQSTKDLIISKFSNINKVTAFGGTGVVSENVLTSIKCSFKNDNQKGNTPGNINNGGWAAIQGDWIYYSNFYYSGKWRGNITKIKTDGSGITRLYDDYSDYINVVGDWIYYNSVNLYKTKTDGSNKTKITDDNCQGLNVVGDWIYYINASDDFKLYKIKTDASGRTKINDDMSYNLNIIDDWIYYGNRNDGNKIYKIKTDGSGKTKINDDMWSGYLNVIDDWIYYSVLWDDSGAPSLTSLGGPLYKIKTDGSNRIKLTDDECDSLNVVGDWIYYSNDSDSGKLYKMKTDGSNKTKIIDDNCDNLNIVGDWIYYMNVVDSFKRYKVKTDGSSRMMVD